jgi:hypothetical protein
LLLSKKKAPADAGAFYVVDLGKIRLMSNTKYTRPSIARGGDGNGYGCSLKIES